MKKIFLITLLTSLFITSAHAGEPLGKIITENGGEKIVLNPSLEKYIKNNLKNFEIVTLENKKINSDWMYMPDVTDKELPHVMVNADFNGDKIDDIALILIKETSLSVFVFHHLPNDQFQHFNLGFSEGITEADPGPIKTASGKGYGDESGPKEVKIKNPGIQCCEMEVSSWVFYWNGKEYDQFWTSD